MTSPLSVFPRAAALIEQGIHDGFHMGAQLYVSIEGRLVGYEAFGEERPDHPMNPETILLWMSSVKPVTAVAVMQLCEKGLLDLDMRIADIIPEFGVGGKEAITLRHVLTHTGGFRGADTEWRDEAWDEAVQRVCAAPLEKGWIPGKKAAYHVDGAWYVLGELIERVATMRYADYLQKHVFAPARMTRAWIGMPPDVLDGEERKIGRMYVLKQGELLPHPFANTREARLHVRPAGNGRGPIRELARFYEDMLAGWLRDESNVLSQESIRLMTGRQREGLFDETFQHKMDWGLGFMPDNNRYGADTVPYGFGKHCSASAFGHGGAQSSVGMADPEHELVVALAFNGMPGEPRHQKRIRHVMSALYEDLDLT